MVTLLNEQAWQRALSALEKFRNREGHCLVSRHYVEETYRLGQWVAVQRYPRTKLPLHAARPGGDAAMSVFTPRQRTLAGFTRMSALCQ
jgi:hypothetical protein